MSFGSPRSTTRFPPIPLEEPIPESAVFLGSEGFYRHLQFFHCCHVLRSFGAKGIAIPFHRAVVETMSPTLVYKMTGEFAIVFSHGERNQPLPGLYMTLSDDDLTRAVGMKKCYISGTDIRVGRSRCAWRMDSAAPESLN